MCPACRREVLRELEQICKEQSAAVGRELQLEISSEAQRQLDILPCFPGCAATTRTTNTH